MAGRTGKPMIGEKNDELREFYENEYERSSAIGSVPQRGDFMHGPVLELLRARLTPDMRVLDLGCNTGNISIFMATQQESCHVTGIDLAENAVETASRTACHHAIPNVAFQRMDFLEDWQEPEAFDLVFCSHVVEHVPQDGKFVRKIAFAMKPGGSLLLLAPTAYCSYYRANKYLFGRCAFDQEVGHLRRYTSEQFRTLAKSSGLRVAKVSYLDGFLREWFILPRRMRVFNRLWARRYIRNVFNTVDGAFARFLCPATIYMLATKPHTHEELQKAR